MSNSKVRYRQPRKNAEFARKRWAPLAVRRRSWIRIVDEGEASLQAGGTSCSGAAHYEYGVWGQPTQTVGTLTADFQYAGYYAHGPSGLNLTVYRAYSPTLGRWINRDPIRENGGTNLYEYSGNAPSMFVDPSGLSYGTNAEFLYDFLFGLGSQNRFYGPESNETQEIKISPIGDYARMMFYKHCLPGDYNGYGTPTALFNSGPFTPWWWWNTAAQVGAANVTVTANTETVTFTVKNKAGRNSFYLHTVEDSETGSGRNIHQTFQWSEPINKCKCGPLI
jgi:RHS repeat-associated protein